MFEKAVQCTRRPLGHDEMDLIKRNFAEMCVEFNARGIVSEETYDRLGFPRDSGVDGVEIEKNTAGSENHQRAVHLTHEIMQLQRVHSEDARAATEAEKVLLETAHRKAILDTAAGAEQKLSKAGTTLAGATPAQLSKALLAGDLEALAHRALFATSKFQSTPALKKMPKKGKPDDLDQSNLIHLVHGLRETPHVLSIENGPEVIEQLPAAPAIRTVSTRTFVALAPPPLASILMADPRFLENIDRILSGVTKLEATPEVLQKVDRLSSLILQRLPLHIERRLSGDERLEKHWVWSWAARQVPRLAAFFVRNNVVGDLRFASSETSLFRKHPGDSFVVFDEIVHAQMGGAYVYLHEGDVVRSGKADLISSRNSGHRDCAKLADLTSRKSKFYRCFPDHVTGSSEQRGLFSELVLCVGFGFSPSDPEATDAVCSLDDFGVFDWPASVLEELGKTFTRCTSLRHKQQVMAGYMAELFLDLMISPRSNVSMNPGFETALGFFGGH